MSSWASYGDRKVTDPRVWPGVWSTVNVRPASSRSWPSASSSTRSGSANSYFPPSIIWVVSALMPAIGLASRCRSSGWIQAVASYVPATGATHHMWSTCPWVTSTATGLSRCSATTSATPGAASLPGSMTTHSVPGPVAAT